MTVAIPSDAPAHATETVVIKPDRGLLDLDLGAVWRYRELLLVLMMRDIQVLYKQALLGVAWAVLQPVFAVVIFTFVFGFAAHLPSDGIPYPIFAFAGVLPWTYFAEAVRRSGLGLVTDAELVRKIYFPRLIMPLANVISPLVDFCVAFGVLLAMMAWYHVMPSWKLLAVPPLMAIAALLALSMGLWLGPINVRFRDIKHTLPFLIQIWMYASPIVYPLSMVPQQWRTLYSLNPMVGVIEGFRWAVFNKGAPDWTSMGVSLLVLVALLFGGIVFFRRMERSFADLI